MPITSSAEARMGSASAKSSRMRIVEMGQYSQAIIEYESILHRDPNNVEIIAALGEVEERLQKSGQARPVSAPPPTPTVLDASGINLDFQVAVGETGTLMTTSQTQRADGREKERLAPEQVSFTDDGNEPLARFLIQHRLVPEEIVSSALERVMQKNQERAPNTLAVSLIDELSRRGGIELEGLLSNIIDRSKFAYIPLEYYDVDRAVVKMLPEEITLGRLIVPFDVMSRTLMVAMANPFRCPRQGSRAAGARLQSSVAPRFAGGDCPRARRSLPARFRRRPSTCPINDHEHQIFR